MDAVKTGAYLASLRRTQGKTQQEIADALHVSNKTISKWESGGGWPEITVLPALAALYGVTADEILAGETAAGELKPGAPAIEPSPAHRAERFFRLGAGVSALCVLAGILYRYSLNYQQMLLVLLGSGLALWIGGVPALRDRRQFTWMLPLAAGQLWLALWMLSDWGNLAYHLWEWPSTEIFLRMSARLLPWLTWWLFLALIPGAYWLLRALLRRRQPGAALVSPPLGWVLLAAWVGEIGVALWRLAVVRPLAQAFALAPERGSQTFHAMFTAMERFNIMAWAILAIGGGCLLFFGWLLNKK